MEKFGKFAMVVVVLASIAIVVFVGPCSTTGTSTQTQASVPASSAPAFKTFTPAELARNNGKNGKPAYVAVDGLVYDLTGSRTWVNGAHSVCEEDSTAGHDLSEAMREAPRGMRQMLLRFPIVGKMAGSNATPPPGAHTIPSQSVPQRNFTTAELAKYNGQNGQPSYVAADGVVYDVSSSSMWSGGKHSMCKINSTAGRDLTQALNQSPPNMRVLLKKFPVVGRLQ